LSTKGFIYSGGKFTYLLPEGLITADANDVKNNGIVVGEGHDGSSQEKGFIATHSSPSQ